MSTEDLLLLEDYVDARIDLRFAVGAVAQRDCPATRQWEFEARERAVRAESALLKPKDKQKGK
jgi:hypothetical protein